MSTILEFIGLAEARLRHLGQQHADATRIGDVPLLAAIELEIIELEQTLAQLRTI